MRKLPLLLAIATLTSSSAAPSLAQIALGPHSSLVFAPADEGRKLLGQRDDFVARMSPFDRASRLKTDQPVDEKTYLAFVEKHVLDWPEADRQKVEAALGLIRPRLAEYARFLPPTVQLIRTTGDEEGNAAYTRGSAVILPKIEMDKPPEALAGLIAHELFHVLSRANPKLRDRLYETIGFKKCPDVALPPALFERKLTNPDAPANDHCIRLKIDGQPAWVIPVLISRSQKYDVARGGAFFEYLQLKFLLVERDEAGKTATIIYRDQAPVLAEMGQLTDFYEQVGRNTSYIIHPEEILAENFRLLITGSEKLKTPEIIEKLKAVLAADRR